VKKMRLWAAAAILVLSPAASVRAADSTGIAACDDFFAKYEACIKDKAPADKHAAAPSALDPTRQPVIQMGKDPATKPQAESVCTQIMASVKPHMTEIGCAF
jgi:hypothetical protein